MNVLSAAAGLTIRRCNLRLRLAENVRTYPGIAPAAHLKGLEVDFTRLCAAMRDEEDMIEGLRGCISVRTY